MAGNHLVGRDHRRLAGRFDCRARDLAAQANNFLKLVPFIPRTPPATGPNGMTDWKTAQQFAAHTAKWAVTMTKVRIVKTIARTKWQLVTFLGPAGAECVGIVDMMLIRKNHSLGKPPLKRGDLFEVILVQVKGGTAPFPSIDEVQRLRAVGRAYRAKAILLAQWKRGRQVEFFRLRRGKSASPRDCWAELDSLGDMFH